MLLLVGLGRLLLLLFLLVASLLGARDVGILSVIQPEQHDPETAPIVLTLHFAPFGVVRQAIAAITALDCVRESPVLMRVEDL